jgi:hypothetical protein
VKNARETFNEGVDMAGEAAKQADEATSGAVSAASEAQQTVNNAVKQGESYLDGQSVAFIGHAFCSMSHFCSRPHER